MSDSRPGFFKSVIGLLRLVYFPSLLASLFRAKGGLTSTWTWGKKKKGGRKSRVGVYSPVCKQKSESVITINRWPLYKRGCFAMLMSAKTCWLMLKYCDLVPDLLKLGCKVFFGIAGQKFHHNLSAYCNSSFLRENNLWLISNTSFAYKIVQDTCSHVPGPHGALGPLCSMPCRFYQQVANRHDDSGE